MSDSYIALVEKSIDERTQQYQELLRLRAELTAVTAERDRMREALRRIDGMATTICMKADAGYGMNVEIVMPIYETARAALEGVTEKEGDGNE